MAAFFEIAFGIRFYLFTFEDSIIITTLIRLAAV